MKLAAVLVLTTATAQAGHSTYSESAEDKAEDVIVEAADAATQWEAGIGMRLGSFHTGPVYNSAFGFGLTGGMRRGNIAVIGEYTFLGLMNPDDSSSSSSSSSDDRIGLAAPYDWSTTPTGMAQRFGAMFRYDIFRGSLASGGMGLFGDLYLEAGLGEQLIRWSGGGYVHRPDVSLGFGSEFGGRGRDHHGGMSMGFRATLAAPPKGSESDAITCAGPCDGPTGPIGIDRSLLFTMDFTFGS